jgi:predicted O-methyltransferase YrrM
MQESWSHVDQYITDLLVRPDPALANALDASTAAGLPAIAVSPPQGKLLSLLVAMAGARRVLEIGTLGGYSTIWLAQGLGGGGRIVTLELEPKHAAVARENVARAGHASTVEIRVGPAAESLRALAAEQAEPFDFVFIDADKTGYPEYLTLVLPLVKPGSVIVADNTVRDGKIADAGSTDPDVRAVRQFHEMIAKNARLGGTAIQTVGSKGYDGFTMVVVQ